MVAKILVDRDIAGGQELVGKLRDRMRVAAAFWLYEPDTESWRLVIATPVWDREGPRVAYGKIQEALDEIPEITRPSLLDISAVSSKDSTAQALRRLVNTGPHISDVRVSRSVVDGVYIDDALVYLTN